jgi:class 3 adenylate cyclase/predicted ATPase
MTFDEILDQVITLLKRQGRVSYPALKRRFALDDDYIEDLKTEILYVHPVVDDDGKGLLWTGEATTQPASTSTLLAQQGGIPQDQSTQVAPRPTAPPSPDAERRQLTVMFCDLVDSTRLSSRFDPEEYREVVRAYQSACTEVIQRYDGHIAQLLGDGLLVYFGYPHAHEDDAHRAVRTGLGILDAMGNLNQRLQRERGIQLGVHIGVHTGLVVVGKMGDHGRQERLALGETPNIAARIEGFAQPNTVAISEATWRLVQGYFACEALGEQTLRGVAEPIRVYRVLSESGATSRLEVAQPRGLTPLIGREQEVGLLVERWEQVKAGQGHVVLLTGDAGIGKSRLVQRLKEHVANQPHTRWECRSSSYFENTALFPLTDLFQRLLRFQVQDTPDEKLAKLEQMLSQYRLPLEESVQLFAPLLSLPIPEDRYSALNLSPQRMRQKTLETIVAILLELAEHQPVLFIVEDLHWTDPTTLELLNLVLDQTPTASLLVLLTCRPHFQPVWHHRSYLTEITVNRLAQPQIVRMVERIADGKILPPEVMQQIFEKTDGVPLFIEELTKAILESGQLKALDGHYEFTGSLSTFAIPATLQDSLMARLDRLVTAKAVAQYAAVIGRQFSYDLLQAVSQVDETMLQHELGRLVEAEIVYHRGLPPRATYTFKHALIQDAAYESLLKSTRQQYHHRIAQVLEAQFPEIVETTPEVVAHHYMEAGFPAQAVDYWHTAGQRARQHSAHREAIAHLNTGLTVLATCPATVERTRQELTLLMTLGPLLMAVSSYGAPDVERTYRRAQALCQQVDDQATLFPVLVGRWSFHLLQGHYQSARDIAEQLLALAQKQPDAALLVEAHFVLGNTLCWMGEFVAAAAHLEQGITRYDVHHHRAHAGLYGQDTGITCLSYAAWTLWLLGYPDQAQQRGEEAMTLAHDLRHPFSLVFALDFATRLRVLRREWQRAQAHAEAMLTLTTEYGFGQYTNTGTVLHGVSLVAQGHAEGLAQIRHGLTARQFLGLPVRPYQLTLLLEALIVAGQHDDGLQVVTEALALVPTMGERVTEAELYRLKGVLLLAQSSDNHTEAEACFAQAMTIAQNQSAKSWELRAATSLTRLWQCQGKRQEAHDLLAPVYHWFTEGFDTVDLQEAKALLDELAEGQS